MISIDTKVNLAFLVSVLSIVWNVVQYKKNQKLDKIRIYDKVYAISEWLLMYEYNQIENIEYTSDDKILESAVREYAKSYKSPYTILPSIDFPDNLKSEKEKSFYLNHIETEYKIFQCEVIDKAWSELINHNQSPIFHLKDKEFKENFDYVYKYIGNNLSYFSETTRNAWHSTQSIRIEDVINNYYSLDVLKKNSCDELDNEVVNDPYLLVLQCIRNEYRELIKPFFINWKEFWFNMKNNLPIHSLSKTKHKKEIDDRT